MGIRSRKIMIMNGAFHPRATIGTMYFKSCEGGRVLLSAEESVLAETKIISKDKKVNEEALLKKLERWKNMPK